MNSSKTSLDGFGMAELANATLAAVKEEFNAEVKKMSSDPIGAANQLLEPHSKLKKAAKLLKKADALAQAVLNYTNPCKKEIIRAA